MPTTTHQTVLLHLCSSFQALVRREKLGEVLVCGYPVKLCEGKFREPDLVFVLQTHRNRMREEYTDRADLLMEVVLEGSRRHDLVTKRAEYAEAGIPEYWIVDPRERRITVLTLRGSQYEVHIEAAAGQQATSVLLPGFTVDVAAVFQAAANPLGGAGQQPNS